MTLIEQNTEAARAAIDRAADAVADVTRKAEASAQAIEGLERSDEQLRALLIPRVKDEELKTETNAVQTSAYAVKTEELESEPEIKPANEVEKEF